MLSAVRNDLVGRVGGFDGVIRVVLAFILILLRISLYLSVFMFIMRSYLIFYYYLKFINIINIIIND